MEITRIADVPTEKLIVIHETARFPGGHCGGQDREATPTEVIIYEATLNELERRARSTKDEVATEYYEMEYGL
jgi:hypothetical protein